MDRAILEWLRPIVQTHGPFARVLELGSRDVNGSVRPAFGACDYVGVDMIDGPGVDVVCDTRSLVHRVDLGVFDGIVASSFFEHDQAFWLTLDGVRARLRAGGAFIVTVPNQYFPAHEYPGDFYRFTEQAIREVLFAGFDEIQIDSPICEQNQNIGAWGHWRGPSSASSDSDEDDRESEYVRCGRYIASRLRRHGGTVEIAAVPVGLVLTHCHTTGGRERIGWCPDAGQPAG